MGMPVRALSPHLCEENPAYPRQLIHSIIITSTSARSSNTYKTRPVSSKGLHLPGRCQQGCRCQPSLSQVPTSTITSRCKDCNFLYVSQAETRSAHLAVGTQVSGAREPPLCAIWLLFFAISLLFKGFMLLAFLASGFRGPAVS